MDPVTTSALAATMTAALNSAAGEAGKQAWQTLVARTRDLLGRGSPAAEAIAALPSEAPRTEVIAAAELLTAAATTQPELLAWLVEWQSGTTGNTTNILSGQAHNAVQAHVVNGGVHFGG